MDILMVVALFTVKHFLVDFVWQTQEEIEHKGIYADWKGINHSVKHGIGTLMLMLVIGLGVSDSLLFGFADILIHYHIDWYKQRASAGLTAADRKFWILLGLDQALHHLTYILFLVIILL